MSNFRRVKNSHVFVIPVMYSFECESNKSVTSVKHLNVFVTREEFVQIFHRYDKYVRRTSTNFLHLQYVRMTCMIHL